MDALNAGAQIVERAARAGSTAITAKGAFRYLRAQRGYVRPIGSGKRAGRIQYASTWGTSRRADMGTRWSATPCAACGSKTSERVVSDWRYRSTSIHLTCAGRCYVQYAAWRVRYDRYMTAQCESICDAGRYLADRRRKPASLLSRDGYLALGESECAARSLMTLDAAEKLSSEYDVSMCVRAAAGLMASWPFARAASSWAGGEHSVSVLVDESGHGSASGGSDKVWSDNGKWSGRNSSATIHATRGAFAHFPTLRTADGSIVVDAELIAPREYRIRWVEQSRGFDLRTTDGWLIRGYHVRAATIGAARKKARAAREEAVAAALKRRHAKLGIRRDWGSVFVAVEDSIAAGNCKPITEQFAAQAYRAIGASGPCAVRADIVLSLRDDSFVRRALSVARTHQYTWTAGSDAEADTEASDVA